MRIEEICAYLNELGILDIKHTSIFLSLYSGFIMNNKQFKQNQSSENNTFKIILFAYLKKIVSNDKELYQICSNIISSYNKNKLIRKYQSICFLNKVLFYQVKNKFNHFLFLLFKKKYPKRKYFPYNPSEGIKLTSKSYDSKSQKMLNNTNRTYKNNNNIYNNFEDYSLSYISMNNNSKNNGPYNLILNTTGSRDNIYMDQNEYKLSHMNNNELPRIRRISPKKRRFIDVTERMNMKKKEITLNNMKKKLYDAQTRINNYENILPTSCKNRQKEIKEKEEENYYNKLKEDQLYQKLTEKKIDKNNILDRLYRTELIKIHDNKRKEKEKKARIKSPINWDKVNIQNTKKKNLNINMNQEDINSLRHILNRPQNNLNSNKKGSFSFRNSMESQNNNNEGDNTYQNKEIENNVQNINNMNMNNNQNYYKNSNNKNISNYNNYNYNQNYNINNNNIGNNINNNFIQNTNIINNKNNKNNINYENINNNQIVNYENSDNKNQNDNDNMNEDLYNDSDNKENRKNIQQIQNEINNLKSKIDSNFNKIKKPSQEETFNNDSFGNIKPATNQSANIINISKDIEQNNINNNNTNNDTEQVNDKINEYYDYPQKYDSSLKRNKKNKITNEEDINKNLENN